MKPTQWIPVRRHITWVRAFRFVPAARFGLLAIAIGLAGCTSPSDRELQRMVLRVDSLAQAVTALGRASGRGAVAARAIRPAGTRITGALREGDPTSPFVLVEFTDYFCPFCATWAVSMLPELTGQYAQKAGLEVVVRNYPIKEIHPHAMRVASLVECARDALPAAGWKLYRSFYARGETLDSAGRDELVRASGIPDEDASKCLASVLTHPRVTADLREAARLGVRGTPAFILGRRVGTDSVAGVLLDGAYPAAEIKRLVDSLRSAGT